MRNNKKFIVIVNGAHSNLHMYVCIYACDIKFTHAYIKNVRGPLKVSFIGNGREYGSTWKYCIWNKFKATLYCLIKILYYKNI